MANMKTPTQLATDSENFAVSFEIVFYKGDLYIPVDYETGDDTVTPSVDRKSWKRMTEGDILAKARSQYDILFKDRAQAANFTFMVQQAAQLVEATPPGVLIKTTAGLRMLGSDGTLVDPPGTFVPNTVHVVLNEDAAVKQQLVEIMTEWLGGEEEILTSQLRHYATVLAPHWSAGRYVLNIGDGRNGKSAQMLMLQDLIGVQNCSSVTRQQIAEGDKNVFDLNGALLNLVFDGPADFVKDSGNEKSLITGETISVRKLYQNQGTPVQTNALFVEGLNQEPKSRDKTSALQHRLARFHFPNRYPDDESFLQWLRSPEILGAFLSLLLDNYVQQKDKAVMLAPTHASMMARLEHMEENSLALQFLMHLEETVKGGAEKHLLGLEFDVMWDEFRSWRLSLNDLTAWDRTAVLALFRPVLSHARKSARVTTKNNPTKVRYITSLKQDALDLIVSVKEDAAHVVEDGSV